MGEGRCRPTSLSPQALIGIASCTATSARAQRALCVTRNFSSELKGWWGGRTLSVQVAAEAAGVGGGVLQALADHPILARHLAGSAAGVSRQDLLCDYPVCPAPGVLHPGR